LGKLPKGEWFGKGGEHRPRQQFENGKRATLVGMAVAGKKKLRAEGLSVTNINKNIEKDRE